MGDNFLGPGGEDVCAEDLVPPNLSFAPLATSIAFNIISVPVKNCVPKAQKLEVLPFQQSSSFFHRKDLNWENIAVLLKVVLHLILHRLFVGYSAREWMDGWMFSLVHRLTPWHCLFVCLVQFEYQAYLLGTITLGNGHVLISAPTTISKFHNIML